MAIPFPNFSGPRAGTTNGAALEKRLCEFGNILLMIRFVSTSVELTNAHSDVSAESPDAKEPIAILPIDDDVRQALAMDSEKLNPETKS